jgi:regulatory protein
MDFETAKNKAINYIGIAKKTSYEVSVKLERLGYSSQICDKVVKYLEGLNYLNDKEYVDAYIIQNMRLLKYSIFEIKQKLLQKGINKDIISEKLATLISSSYESDVIKKHTKTKLKSQDELKIKQYLYRRGFKNIEIEG